MTWRFAEFTLVTGVVTHFVMWLRTAEAEVLVCEMLHPWALWAFVWASRFGACGLDVALFAAVVALSASGVGTARASGFCTAVKLVDGGCWCPQVFGVSLDCLLSPCNSSDQWQDVVALALALVLCPHDPLVDLSSVFPGETRQ